MNNNWYPASYLSVGTAENAVLKAQACRLGFLSVNSTNAACYVKLYDKATAPAATDTPVAVFYVPATTGQVSFDLPAAGLMFKRGLGLRIVTEHADSGTTAVTAGAVSVNYGLG